MQEKKTVGQATASLVLGIISVLLFGILTAIPAVIFGHMAKKKIKQNPSQLKGEGAALAGLIMGYITISISVVLIGIFILFTSACDSINFWILEEIIGNESYSEQLV